jgi:protein SCO1/2
MRSVATLITLAVVAAAMPVSAQLAGEVPAALQEVGVIERFGAEIPLELEFVDDRGQQVRLGDYFDGERPVVLTLNYYNCPMLCTLQLNGLIEGLRDLAWTPGEQFELVTVSINPLETAELAAAKKQTYMRSYDRPEAGPGWHFLTGREADIQRLAATVGFGYTYDEESQQYAHAAVLFVITPDGKVARYLYGIELPARQLRLSLLEASEGSIGTPLDQLLMFCYHYDPSSRRYGPVAMNIMRLGGSATALLLGSGLGLLWIREARKRRRDAPPGD